MNCTPKCKCISVGVLGICLIVFTSIIGWVVVPIVVKSKIADILALKPNTETWERWEKLPVPVKYSFYVFNVENPMEIMEGKKPILTEIGPYVYKEKRIKEVLDVDEENGTIKYNHQILFEFDQVASGNLTEDDELTVHNAAATLFGLVVDNLKNLNKIIHHFDSALTKMWPVDNPVFVKTKVKDFIFEGIPIMCNHQNTLDNIEMIILCEALRVLNPRPVKFQDNGIHSFAIFRSKNESSDGIYVIDSGTKDIRNVGQILSWNGKTKLNHWGGDICNKLHGTDATIFRPYLEEENVQEIHIFHTDVCRSLKLTYDRNTEFKGIKGRRYTMDKSVFEGVLENKDNYCFCPQSVKGVTHYGGCLKSGLLELSSSQDVPAIISYPHFLKADPAYQGNIVGMNPDIERHNIFVDLEPNTGYPLRAASRVQLNVHLKKVPEVTLLRNVTETLLPFIWMEETVELTDDLIEVLNQQLLNILKIVDIGKWVAIGVGISLLLGSFIYYLAKIRPQQRIEENESTEFEKTPGMQKKLGRTKF